MDLEGIEPDFALYVCCPPANRLIWGVGQTIGLVKCNFQAKHVIIKWREGDHGNLHILSVLGGFHCLLFVNTRFCQNADTW